MESTGKLGEHYAAKWYEKAGFQILERNFHTRYGEVDIIAINQAYIVFVEVKTREVDGLTHPAESVTIQKQRKIIKTAQAYLQSRRNMFQFQPRFDVVCVFTSKGHVIKMEQIENAFNVQ